jgi:hypothetical protein
VEGLADACDKIIAYRRTLGGLVHGVQGGGNGTHDALSLERFLPGVELDWRYRRQIASLFSRVRGRGASISSGSHKKTVESKSAAGEGGGRSAVNVARRRGGGGEKKSSSGASGASGEDGASSLPASNPNFLRTSTVY